MEQKVEVVMVFLMVGVVGILFLKKIPPPPLSYLGSLVEKGGEEGSYVCANVLHMHSHLITSTMLCAGDDKIFVLLTFYCRALPPLIV